MSAELHNDLLTVTEVCELLKIKRSYLYSMTHRRAIPHIRMLGQLRFRRRDIDEWLRSQEQEVRIVGSET